MTCHEANELIAAAWKGELDPARQAILSVHLESCAECSAGLASTTALWDRLGDLPAPEPGYSLDARWQLTLRTLTEEAERNKRWVFPWPRRPLWQAAIALGSLAIGLAAGFLLAPRAGQRTDEIAKLHDEVANMRAMVALSLLHEESASERLRGVDYGGRLAAMAPEVAAALVEAVRHDPSVNVRLAAIDALSGRTDVAGSLAGDLPGEQSPMVQAALVDYLVDADDRQAIGTIRTLAARPDLNPAVRERIRFAIEKLGPPSR